MDPQIVFLVWLPVFVVSCAAALQYDHGSRKEWKAAYFLSGSVLYRRVYEVGSSQHQVPDVELLKQRFASRWGWTMEFQRITPTDIAFRGEEYTRLPVNALMHGCLQFDLTTGRVVVVGYANRGTLWFFGGLGAFALLSMNAAAWAIFLMAILLAALTLWGRSDHYGDIGQYAAFLLARSAVVSPERA
ncbi:MAG TPA: hypothetical protein PLC98_22390 [Anaerolineales bacterium]|nr:hypothetical protein [Anaerolineales bacterium]